ncbi:MAG: tetratricopeptide repeat protein, partial [Hyphomicrobium sp.]
MAKKKDDEVLDDAQDVTRGGAASKETDDIFREVEEEIRKERFEKLWAEYGTYIAAVALAIVVLVGGWKFYEHRQAQRAEEAGARFNAALLALEAKKSEDAEKALQVLGQAGQGGYRALAQMRLAALEQSNGKPEAAVKAYDSVAADAGVDQTIRGLASLRAAMLRIDAADWTEMQNRLTPLK